MLLPDHITPKWEAVPTRNAFRSTPYGETTKTVTKGEATFTAASINTDKSTSSRSSTRICISTMCHALCATPLRKTHSLCYPPSPRARVDGSAPISDISWRYQGDPISALFFSLVILELLDSLDYCSGLLFQLWYLDDGFFVGNRESIWSPLQSLMAKGPIFELHSNLNKCELYWSSGGQNFPEFPSKVRWLSEGIELQGSPVHGSVEFSKSTTAKGVDKILESQSNVANRDDPKVELHLLQTCQSVCKVNRILRSVEQLHRFDQGLRRSLEICRSSVTELVWLQSTLPITLAGLGLREAV